MADSQLSSTIKLAEDISESTKQYTLALQRMSQRGQASMRSLNTAVLRMSNNIGKAGSRYKKLFDANTFEVGNTQITTLEVGFENLGEDIDSAIEKIEALKSSIEGIKSPDALSKGLNAASMPSGEKKPSPLKNKLAETIDSFSIDFLGVKLDSKELFGHYDSFVDFKSAATELSSIKSVIEGVKSGWQKDGLTGAISEGFDGLTSQRVFVVNLHEIPQPESNNNLARDFALYQEYFRTGEKPKIPAKDFGMIFGTDKSIASPQNSKSRDIATNSAKKHNPFLLGGAALGIVTAILTRYFLRDENDKDNPHIAVDVLGSLVGGAAATYFGDRLMGNSKGKAIPGVSGFALGMGGGYVGGEGAELLDKFIKSLMGDSNNNTKTKSNAPQNSANKVDVMIAFKETPAHQIEKVTINDTSDSVDVTIAGSGTSMGTV